MSISNGALIAEADLTAMNASALTAYQTYLLRDPDYFVLNAFFKNVEDDTTLIKRTARIVMPDTVVVADVNVQGGNTGGTITVTLDTGLLAKPMSFTGTMSDPGINKLSRFYTTSNVYRLYEPLQIFIKGTTLDVVVETSDSGGTHNFMVSIGLYGGLRRL